MDCWIASRESPTMIKSVMPRSNAAATPWFIPVYSAMLTVVDERCALAAISMSQVGNRHRIHEQLP
ncbi:hypothetical protein PF003_g28884 [Phytophthora fragariae]|nr:hypothetical protein PF003_g28884 [Phytophthora fragariae]